MGVAALFALFTALLVILAFGDSPTVWVTVLAFGALSLFGTQQITESYDDLNRRIRLDGTAVYMGVGERIAQFYQFVDEIVPALGHVPFDGSFDGDCGLWGGQVDPDAVAGSVPGAVGAPRATRNDAVLGISGWVDAASIDCLLVVDAEQTVVGIAHPGYAAPEDLPADLPLLSRSGLEGLVLVDHVAPLTVIARLEGDDTFVMVAEVPEQNPSRPDASGETTPEENEP
jgi:hypothetical protein